MHFSLTENDLTIFRAIALVVMVICWVLGVKAVTSEGKLFEFVGNFFEQKVTKRQEVTEAAAKSVDLGILSRLTMSDGTAQHQEEFVSRDLAARGYDSDVPISQVIKNVEAGITNKYFFYAKVMRFSWHIVDPVIGCPTCMPSLHTLFVYSIVCWQQGWHWNPFVWMFCAMMATFWTEQLWSLRAIINEQKEKSKRENKKNN